MLFSFAFFAGVVVLLCLPTPSSMGAGMCIALLSAGALAWRLAPTKGGDREPRHRWPCVVVTGFGLGFLFAGAHQHAYLSHCWPQALDNERVLARATVISIPAWRADGWSFDAELDIEAPAAHRRTLRARLVSRDQSIRPTAGDRWYLLLSLRAPRGRSNPGGPDLETLLLRDGVHAFGTVVPSRWNRFLDTGHRPLAALRERVSRHIQSQVVDRDAAALFAALAVGDTGAVSREQWRIFNATGTTHLVAISGLHVTMFAAVAFVLARRLWAMFPPMALPREVFAAIVGFTSAATYATVAGLSVPTQRTLIMLGVWLLARSLARASRPFHPFALALIAVLLVDPFAPLSAGFWLSFAAMAAIIAVTASPVIRRPWWREAIAVQAAVTVALVPFTAALFGSVSLVGPLVNIVAIPAMSGVLVPMVLMALVLLPVSSYASSAVLHVAERLHDVGWPLLAAAGDLPWALIHLSPPWWWYALALAAVALSLMPLPLRLRVAALIGVMPLAATVEGLPDEGEAQITVLDVGERLSVVVRTARHVLVFGTGEGYGTEGRVTANVLVPFLRSRGVRTVDRLILSPASATSSAGVPFLMAEIPVLETFVEAASSEGDDELMTCTQAPSTWSWDGVTFEWLRPAQTQAGTDAVHACVLSIRAGCGRMLLPGALDARAQAALAASGDLRSDIVVVPRTGSSPGSSLAFIGAVHPRWAVVNGRRAQGPAIKPDVIRWEKAGARVLSTDESGAIHFRLAPPRGGTGDEQCGTPRLERRARSGMMPPPWGGPGIEECGKSCGPADR